MTYGKLKLTRMSSLKSSESSPVLTGEDGLHIQQQMLALPRRDDLLVGVVLRRLHVAVEGDEFRAQHVLQVRAAAEAPDGIQDVARELVARGFIRVALHRLGRHEVLDHAEIAAGERR